MFNPAAFLKAKAAKDKFFAAHPKFIQFFKDVWRDGVAQDAVLEVAYTAPDGAEKRANIRVTAEDVALLNELAGLVKGL